MSDFEKKCKIQRNNDLGRYVAAAINIRGGERVLFEQPAIILPQMGERRCANCWNLALNFCKKCQLTALCHHCREHSQVDCDFLAACRSKVNIKLLHTHFADIQGLVSCLLMRENMKTRAEFEQILELEAHVEERRHEPVWRELNKTVVGPLMKSGLLQQFTDAAALSEEYLQRLLSVVDVNAFELRAPDEGSLRGMYLRGLLLSHSCCANCTVAIDDTHNMTIYANRNIEMDETINHCYTNPLLGTADRREMLRMGKYFHCNCARCEDPTEFGSNMSTLRCDQSKCNQQNTDTKVLRVIQPDGREVWKCLNCDELTSNEEVVRFVDQAKTDIILAHGDLYSQEALLAKLRHRLHSNHSLVIDLMQNIAAMLRDVIANAMPRYKLSRKVFERKIELCEKVLEVLQCIQPGISRLRGIALYEMVTAQVEVQRLLFNANEIDRTTLKNHLVQSGEKLRESLRQLIYEPPQTPEGRLAKSVLAELQDLQREINSLAKLE